MNAYCDIYPNTPGFRDTDTSIAAADAIASSAGRLQRMVLFAVREVGERGLTSEEIAARLDVGFASIQPRTSELRRKGLIEDSGQRRRNLSGKAAIVWTATPSGEASNV
jgi:predicted transcriptional regulator